MGTVTQNLGQVDTGLSPLGMAVAAVVLAVLAIGFVVELVVARDEAADTAACREPLAHSPAGGAL